MTKPSLTTSASGWLPPWKAESCRDDPRPHETGGPPEGRRQPQRQQHDTSQAAFERPAAARSASIAFRSRQIVAFNYLVAAGYDLD